MFAEALQRGLAAGGWVIGLLVSLGGFLILVGAIGLALTYIIGDREDVPQDEKGVFK